MREVFRSLFWVGDGVRGFEVAFLTFFGARHFTGLVCVFDTPSAVGWSVFRLCKEGYLFGWEWTILRRNEYTGNENSEV